MTIIDNILGNWEDLGKVIIYGELGMVGFWGAYAMVLLIAYFIPVSLFQYPLSIQA